MTPRIEIVLENGNLTVKTQNADPLIAFGMLELAKAQLLKQMSEAPRIVPVSAIPGL